MMGRKILKPCWSEPVAAMGNHLNSERSDSDRRRAQGVQRRLRRRRNASRDDGRRRGFSSPCCDVNINRCEGERRAQCSCDFVVVVVEAR